MSSISDVEQFPRADPYDLRWMSEHKASRMEIGVLGDDDVPVLGGVGPNRVVVSSS
jgi:hypothetical protein